MSSEHFKEILGVLKMTYGVSQYRVARMLKHSQTTIHKWREEGVPIKRVAAVRRMIRNCMREVS